MRIRLRGTATAPEQQRENDRRFQVSTLVGFFALVIAYAYLLTHLGEDLGLPTPEQVFKYPAHWISYSFPCTWLSAYNRLSSSTLCREHALPKSMKQTYDYWHDKPVG